MTSSNLLTSLPISRCTTRTVQKFWEICSVAIIPFARVIVSMVNNYEPAMVTWTPVVEFVNVEMAVDTLMPVIRESIRVKNERVPQTIRGLLERTMQPPQKKMGHRDAHFASFGGWSGPGSRKQVRSGSSLSASAGIFLRFGANYNFG